MDRLLATLPEAKDGELAEVKKDKSIDSTEVIKKPSPAEPASTTKTAISEKTKSSSLPPAYLFPGDDPAILETIEKHRSKTTHKILAILEELSTGKTKKDGKRLPYDEIRKYTCAFSLLLNERQHCPPQFRPIRSLRWQPKGVRINDEEKILSNDRQVIDLHWLWVTGQGNPVKKWKDIFGTEHFNFSRASEFVTKVGNVQNKVDELRLSEFEMHQLEVILTETVRSSIRHIFNQAEKNEPLFHEWIKSPKGRINDSVENLKAQFIAIKFSDDDITRAVKLYEQLTQQTISKKTMRRRLDKFIQLDLMRKPSIKPT